jgi:uncharacterized repeat protein (TIGR03803 family)
VSSLARKLVFVLFVAAIAAQAQTYTPIYNLGSTAGDPMNPQPFSFMSQGRDGRIFSTTQVGGAHNTGAGYAITTSGVVTVLHSFDPYPAPTAPWSGLALGLDGNYYGTTSSGGAHAVGTVFKLTDAGVYTTLWDFTGSADQGTPEAPLVLGADGNLYGTTDGVYSGQYGTAFKITPKGALTTIHVFNFTDGAVPYVLILGLDGNFYGTTRLGGAHNLGVIFKMTKAGKVTVLHHFAGTAGTDGQLPIGGIAQGNDGTIYGTTYQGGTKNAGTVYKISPSGNGYVVLHNFDRSIDINDGALPLGDMNLGTDGNVYGTTGNGGKQNDGALFRITPAGVYSTLYSFCPAAGCKDGFFPQTGMTQHTNGKFYGATESAGTSVNGGEFFSLDMGLGPFVDLIGVWGKVGSTIEILGQGFNGATSVKLGGSAAHFNIVSDTYMTATVPDGSSGFVTVATAGGTLTSSRKFLVTPLVTSFTPASGPVGTQVIVTGKGLIQATKVAFGSKNATFVVNSDTQVTATVPAGAVTNKITITTPGGKASSKAKFTVT